MRFIQLFTEPIRNVILAAQETNEWTIVTTAYDLDEVVQLVPVEPTARGQNHCVSLPFLHLMRKLRMASVAAAFGIGRKELQKMRADGERSTFVALQGKGHKSFRRNEALTLHTGLREKICEVFCRRSGVGVGPATQKSQSGPKLRMDRWRSASAKGGAELARTRDIGLQ